MRRPNGLRTKPPVTPGLAAYIHDLNVFFFLFYSEGAETKRCFFHSFFAPLMERKTATQYFCQNPTSLLPRLPANNYHRNYPSRRRRPDEVFLTVSRTRIDVGDG